MAELMNVFGHGHEYHRSPDPDCAFCIQDRERRSAVNERLYRVNVKGGGEFLYDLTDVGRFAQRMATAGDERAFSISVNKPAFDEEGSEP